MNWRKQSLSPFMKTTESHSFTFCCGPSHSIQEVFRKMFRSFYFLSFSFWKSFFYFYSLSSFFFLIFGDLTFCRAKFFFFFFHSPVSSVSQLPRLIHQSTQFLRYVLISLKLIEKAIRKLLIWLGNFEWTLELFSFPNQPTGLYQTTYYWQKENET